MKLLMISALSLLMGCSSMMTYSAPAIDELMGQVDQSPPKQQHPCLSWDLRGAQKTPFSKSLYILDDKGRLVRESVRYFGDGFPYKLSVQDKPKLLSSYSRELEYNEQGQLISLKELGLSELLAVTTFTYDDAKRLIKSERHDTSGRLLTLQTVSYDGKGRPDIERLNPDSQGHALEIIVHRYPDLEPSSLQELVADQILLYLHREDGKLEHIEQVEPQDVNRASFIYGEGGELLREVRPYAELSFTYDDQLRLKTREVNQGKQIIERIVYHHDRAGHLIWSHAEDKSGQSRWIFNDYRCEKPEVKS